MADSIIEKLFDEENSDNITLYDETDNPVEFEQIALIPLGGVPYVILQPVDEVAGVGEDEAIVFAIREDNTEDAYLEVVEDDDVIDAVFEEYYRLLEEAGAETDEG